MKMTWVAVCTVGALLILFAGVNVTSVPIDAHKDFDRLVAENKGSLQCSDTYRDAVLIASANSRLLQNFWVGSSGLMLLAGGLAGIVKYSRAVHG